MPNCEDRPVATFFEQRGGPLIGFIEYSGDDWDVQSRLPAWITQYEEARIPTHFPFVVPDRSQVISRELASAAARQILLAWGPQSIKFVSLDQPARSLLASKEQPIIAMPADHSVKGSAEVCALEDRIRFLESQLEAQLPYRQLYRLGAGSLFVAVISIVIWLLTGTGIPFHPIFAAGVIPTSLGVIAMAFLVRSDKSKKPK